jgi:hypothetical protein
MRTPLLQLIERCRRQQQQKPGQLEMLSEDEERKMGSDYYMLDPANVDRSGISNRHYDEDPAACMLFDPEFQAEDDLTLADIDEQEEWEEHCRLRIEQMQAEQDEWDRTHGITKWATEGEALEQWREAAALGELSPTRELLPPY